MNCWTHFGITIVSGGPLQQLQAVIRASYEMFDYRPKESESKLKYFPTSKLPGRSICILEIWVRIQSPTDVISLLMFFFSFSSSQQQVTLKTTFFLVSCFLTWDQVTGEGDLLKVYAKILFSISVSMQCASSMFLFSCSRWRLSGTKTKKTKTTTMSSRAPAILSSWLSLAKTMSQRKSGSSKSQDFSARTLRLESDITMCAICQIT